MGILKKCKYELLGVVSNWEMDGMIRLDGK